MNLRIIGLVVLLLASALIAADKPVADDPALKANAESLKRWQEMRFGLFIHWGPVALTGEEIGWSRGKPTPVDEYDNHYKKFNPVKFNADEWVSIAEAAGMKYVVLTAKHHDGFCLWATKTTDYNITNTPFKRDVTRELADACRKHGLVFCTYYSVCDWWHPDYPLGSPGGKTQKPSPNMDRYVQYMKTHLAELIQNYGPLGILWFDGEWEKPWTEQQGIDLYRYLRQLQPTLLVNNRVTKARRGMAGVSDPSQFSADYDTPEQRVGKYQDSRPWETNMTICKQWAWKPNDPMKSLQECLHTLVRTVGGDGNFLFNVGPTPEGLIEPRQADRLKEMGDWLAKNGESIYATRGGPYKPAPHVASTRKDKTLYLHILSWPEETLKLPPLPAKIVSSRLLGGAACQVKQTDTALEISVAPANRHPVNTILVLTLDKPAMELSPITVIPESPEPAKKH